MKTAISIPDPLFAAADEAADRLEISRSEFYARAIEAYLQSQSAADVTRRLNDVYATESSSIDPLLVKASLRSLEASPW